MQVVKILMYFKSFDCTQPNICNRIKYDCNHTLRKTTEIGFVYTFVND